MKRTLDFSTVRVAANKVKAKAFVPPWETNGIGKHPYLEGPVKMVDIDRIRPEHGRNTRPSKPVDLEVPYTPLVIDTRGVLQDGYHRYFDLFDRGYRGKVPVVVYE
jgi:hypothetical protein